MTVEVVILEKKLEQAKAKIQQLDDQIEVLEKEIRDTYKKVRSKLDFLLKRIQSLESDRLEPPPAP